MKFLVEVTLHLDNPREINLDRVIMKAIDHAIESNIDGYDGIDVTWSDIRITGGAAMILHEDMVIRTIEQSEGKYFHAGDLARMFLAMSRDPNLTMVHADHLRRISNLIKELAAKEV